MSEPFVGNEMSEELEGTEALSRATQELNEITYEPESYIETKIDVAQSEVIETSFNELVNNRASGEEIEIPALDGSSRPGSDRTGDVKTDEVDCDPIPLPYPASEVESSPPKGPGGGSTPAAEDDWESPNVNVAINPDPIFHEAGESSINPEPIFREAGEIEEANELPMHMAQEPTSLLTDNEILAIQNQLETNTEDFIIVSVLTESTGSAAKNSISNIR